MEAIIYQWEIYVNLCRNIWKLPLKNSELKLNRDMNPCQHDYWGKDAFKCNAGKKEKIMALKILGKFALLAIAYWSVG